MTNRLELNWELDGFVDEQRYYCSEFPIDIENLPPPKATLDGAIRSYIDTDIESGKTYDICISSVKNNVEKISEIKTVTAARIANYRYLRIYITANNGNTYTSLQEIEIASKLGGQDITTPATPANQSSYFAVDNAQAFKLVDNDFTEYQLSVWISSAVPAPHWVSFDLGEPKDMHELRMWQQNYPDGSTRAPMDFVVQGSMDGLVWVDIKSFTGVTNWIAGVAKSFNLVTGSVT